MNRNKIHYSKPKDTQSCTVGKPVVMLQTITGFTKLHLEAGYDKILQNTSVKTD